MSYPKVSFELRPSPFRLDVESIIRIEQPSEVETPIEEEWCTTADLDALFDACRARWPDGWSLDHVIQAVRNTEVE